MTRVVTGNVAGVLLYAKTDETVTPDDDFNIGDNPISIKTLDLNQDWAGITAQLESLCGWLEVENIVLPTDGSFTQACATNRGG